MTEFRLPFMPLVTSNPSVAAASATPASGPVTLRIEPPHGLFNLHLAELWAYRELLYFLVWRDVKVRYKQTVIGVLWVVLQPLLTMGVFTIFFGRLAKLPSEWPSLSRFLFRCACSLDIFLDGAAELHECRCGQPERDHEGLFPAAGVAGCGCFFWAG